MHYILYYFIILLSHYHPFPPNNKYYINKFTVNKHTQFAKLSFKSHHNNNRIIITFKKQNAANVKFPYCCKCHIFFPVELIVEDDNSCELSGCQIVYIAERRIHSTDVACSQ